MDLSLLLYMSEKFEKEEARADIYPMVRYWIENGDSMIDKIRGVATLLYIWNAGYYGRAKKGFSGAVATVGQLFSDKEFRKLENELENFDLCSINIINYKNQITEFYKCIRKHKGLGPTATSKVLHIIHPKLFVMWDDEISKKFHYNHRKRGLYHSRCSGICYYEFLKDTKKEIKDVLRQVSQKEIKNASFEIAGYKKTIPKIIDEFNYMQYTMPAKKLRTRSKDTLKDKLIKDPMFTFSSRD